MASEKSEFQYRANALALSGEVSYPAPGIVLAQAASVLPPTGGLGTIELGPYAAPARALAYTSASTTVRSRVDPATSHLQTFVNVTIRGLDVANGFVIADRIEANLFSDHDPADGTSDIRPSFASTGLVINGQPCAPVVERSLSANTTWDQLAKLTQPLKSPSGTHLTFDDTTKGTWQKAPLFEPVFPPLVTTGYSPGDGCTLMVAGRGTVVLGEYMITSDSRRLTVIRLDLEGLFEGQVVVGYGETNGHWYP